MRNEAWGSRENFLEIINLLKQYGFKWQQKNINPGSQSNSAAQVHSQDPLQNQAQAVKWSKKPNCCLFPEVKIYCPNDFHYWSKEKQGQVNEKSLSESVQNRNPEWRVIAIEKNKNLRTTQLILKSLLHIPSLCLPSYQLISSLNQFLLVLIFLSPHSSIGNWVQFHSS